MRRPRTASRQSRPICWASAGQLVVGVPILRIQLEACVLCHQVCHPEGIAMPSWQNEAANSTLSLRLFINSGFIIHVQSLGCVPGQPSASPTRQKETECRDNEQKRQKVPSQPDAHHCVPRDASDVVVITICGIRL